MSTLVKVLDHGFVRLVSYMQPIQREASWNGDLEVVRNARVSYDADWRTGEDEGKDTRLLAYMVEHAHTTPFEAMVFTFEVKAPIFVFRQWHRHRTWSYNELSGRYAALKEEFYVPRPERIGQQSETNRQARVFRGQHESFGHWAHNRIKMNADDCFTEYEAMLEHGVPREIARLVLPLNTYSRMFATVDLHNLMHFLKLRLDEHAQWEIQQYARALLLLARQICPFSLNGFPQLEVEE